MHYHNIDWQEYQEADDRVLVASVAQHLVKVVWVELFTLDMRLKEGVGHEDHSLHAEAGAEVHGDEELPSDLEGPNDRWEAEEEHAGWMQGDDASNEAKEGRATEALPGGASCEEPLGGESVVIISNQKTRETSCG